MPDTVFRAKPGFGVNVSNRSTALTPPAGGPIGPQSFPPPPPPPPPPPVPLAVVSVTVEEFASFVAYQIVFDAPVVVTGLPNWTVTGGDAPQFILMDGGPANRVKIVCDQVQSTPLMVPADATGVHSASGGAVVPGSYPVV